jgi:hypothetical protein
MKLFLCLINHHTVKTCGNGGMEPRIVNLDGGEWSASRPGPFTPGKRVPGTHWLRGWVGLRADFDAVYLPLSGIEH